MGDLSSTETEILGEFRYMPPLHSLRYKPTNMRHHLSIAGLLLLLCVRAVTVQADAPPLRDLDTRSPFTPPQSLAAWQERAQDLKLQLQVSLGLFPRPQLDAVAPQIYGRIERDDYTIEKITFESLPGLMVTGNLYRPKQSAAEGKLPAVLAPHGHWEEARFYSPSQIEINQQLASGAERFENAAHNPMQARCVQLARMGCVVLHWDMLGYCDSQQINRQRAHGFANQPAESEVDASGWLLYSPLAEAHNQSVIGLQTLATQRAVDMVLTLPEVDPNRIAISGASGGGTQSFLGAAIDDRIALAFPAVMVSTGMQGGCTCENACLLRTGTGNVELAALIAPRPLGMTAANDWTKTMPQDGFPELQKLYGLFDAKSKVALFPAIHFDHNFNHVARVALYGWVNDHFGLGFEKPILERDFEIALRDELSVWDAAHTQPAGGEAFERRLLRTWAENVDEQMQSQLHGDAKQREQLAHTLQDGWRACLGLTTMLSDTVVSELADGGLRFENADLPQWEVHVVQQETPTAERRATLEEISTGERRATLAQSLPDPAASHAAIMESPKGSQDDLQIEIKNGESTKLWSIRLAGQQTAESDTPSERIQWQALVENPRLAAAYTYGYNLPLFAQRAQQLGFALQTLASRSPQATITLRAHCAALPLAAAAMLVATDRTKPDSAPAATLALDSVVDDFSFAQVASIRDPNFLPGAARYWDVPGLVACCSVETKLSGESDDLARFLALQPIAQILGGSIQ